MSDFKNQQEILVWLLANPLNFVKRKSESLELTFIDGWLKDVKSGKTINFMFSCPEEWIKNSYTPWEDLLTKGDLEGVWCYVSSKTLDAGITNCSIQYIVKACKGMPYITISEYISSLNNTHTQAIPVLCETLNKELLNHPSFTRASIQQHNKL